MRDATIRGKILDFLKHVYPEGADDRSILSVFYQYHHAAAIEQSLEYLTDKGYVTRKDIPHPYRKLESIKLYKISPSGVDLLDGLARDAGVSVVPEGE